VSDTVQIIAPLDGDVLGLSTPAAVRAAVAKPEFFRAELYIDGTQVAVQANRDPGVMPWVVEWGWEDAEEGIHELTVKARSSQGAWETSAPVRVAVVPTGTLLFSSNRHGAYAVYQIQTDGSGLSRLTTGPGDARQPAARRDGVLAYAAETGTGQTMIRQMEIGAAGATDLVVGRDPAWSPQGGHLAYASSQDGISQVFALGADQDEPLQLTSEGVFAGQPAWSADGLHLAYVVEQEGNWDIWVVGARSGEPRRLTDDPAMDWAPAWSPDGSQLALVSNRGGSHQIYTMRLDGTDIRPLTDFAQGAESPVWSPDGFWLAFVAYTGFAGGVDARELYLMRADGQDQVRLTRNAYDDNEPDWTVAP
jgi:TolB protein